ncbi:MAG: EAL domain-containing protein, partial [Planctomycetota bacterium]
RQLAVLEAPLAALRRERPRRRDVESRLAHDALHDVLTGLPNRALVTDRIQTALAACKRDPNRRVALAFIDLDEFKVVNDSLGHEAGDRMLVEIASRIVSSTRQTDCASRNTGNTVARLGGDEFLVLFDGVRRQEDAVFIAERIRENLSAPLVVEEHELRPSASIGLAHGGPEYDDAASLIRDADTALYRAKARGKAGVTVFDAELRREALARMRIETELRKAIGADQLFLEYQPIVSLDTLRTNGFEALVRWNHPEQGVVPPDDFIPLAEQTGLIFPLGEWVLRSTCRQVAEWRRRMPDAKRFFVNVNFSTRQLSMPSFVDDLLEILDESGIARDELHVEMTESVLLQNSGTAGRSLQRMSDEAIALHIDDFGTGFSSLSYLHKLPASAVKLDRSFLQGYIDGDTNEVTIRAIIDMAHARGLKVVAEGIETAEQLELLQRLGCDMGQGFYFARPLAVDVVERWIATQADTLAA